MHFNFMESTSTPGSWLPGHTAPRCHEVIPWENMALHSHQPEYANAHVVYTQIPCNSTSQSFREVPLRLDLI